MKILLVKPYSLVDNIQPSLGLGYLATAARDQCEVKILDCIKENIIRTDRFSRIIKDFNPDLVGIQCYTSDLGFVKEALGAVKNIGRGIITVVGGPHVSAVPKETVRYFENNIDFAFIGEAERGFRKLIDYLNNKPVRLSDIPGLVWRSNGSIRTNVPFFEKELDSLGFPAWDLMPPDSYPETQHGAYFKNFPIAPIITTRGCPYDCSYCAGSLISGKKLRNRTPQHVLEEIKLLYYSYNIREFHIIDDNFTLNKKFAKELLKGIIDLNLKMSWTAPNGVRLDSLDMELLDLMKKSGLYFISVGIESGKNDTLKRMKKNLTIDGIRNNVKIIREAGIDITGFFIIGFPGESREDMEETIKFSLELDLLRASYFIYAPFPGTEGYKSLTNDSESGSPLWAKLDLSKPFRETGKNPSILTTEELKKIQRKAFFAFYLRPRILYKNLVNIKSFRHLWYLFLRITRWII